MNETPKPKFAVVYLDTAIASCERVRTFDTPEQVATYMLGRDSTRYGIFTILEDLPMEYMSLVSRLDSAMKVNKYLYGK